MDINQLITEHASHGISPLSWNIELDLDGFLHINPFKSHLDSENVFKAVATTHLFGLTSHPECRREPTLLASRGRLWR